MFRQALNQIRTNGVNKKQPPQTEVTPKAKRRSFSPQYKLRILEQADQATQPGQIGALLRQEGLYSSLLTNWRRQRAEGQLNAFSTKKRGPKPTADPTLVDELALLRRQNERLQMKLKKAELIIEVQKKVSLLFGLDINPESGAI